eukprot:XP_011677809.1 PREDICTED: uncharacterized protein LOC105444800 [Strongylocentrotus purpuratus]
MVRGPVLESSIDNQYAQVIKTIAKGEMTLNEHRCSGMSIDLRGRMEKVRREIERLSTKPFLWGKIHIDQLSGHLETILGPRPEAKPRAAIPDTPRGPQAVDKDWLPDGLAKQQQPQKPPKGKKKGRSWRPNRVRRDVEVTYSEQDDDETDSEMNTGGSTSSSPGGTPERDKRKPPQGVAKRAQTLQTSVQWSTTNGQRPAISGKRSSPVKGAIPKAFPQVPKPQGQAAVAISTQPPKISPETQQWLTGYEFRLACEACFTQVPHQYGLYSFRLNRDPNHKPACRGGMLVCRLHVPPQNDLKEVYGRIRPRVKQDYRGKYYLCQQFATGIPCKISTASCWFPHSNEEIAIWDADRNGRFNGKEVDTWLRYKLNQEIFEMKRKQAIAQDRVTNQNPPAQALGGNPHATLQVQKGSQQPPAVIRTAPPMSSSPVPHQSQRPLLPSANKVIDPQTRGKLTNLIKNLGGQFLYLCRFCFDDAPQVLSVQNSSNPDLCTGEKSHKWNGPNKCLVHRLCQGGRDRYWKIRKRPNGIPREAFLCWHSDKSYGCPTGSKCSFAHNEIERDIWFNESYQPLDREMLVRVSHELDYGPMALVAPSSTKPASAPVQNSMTPPQQTLIPVFQYKIKVCFQELHGAMCT